MADALSSPRDDAVTLLALGALAYIGETMGHEAIGHGGLCLLTGGRLTALAPLWMRCSVQTDAMVAAGPMFNFAAAAFFALALSVRRRGDTAGYFLWLSLAFNLLVACGYLIVGAAGFGDWSVLIADAAPAPAWPWRVAAALLGLCGYIGALAMLGRLYAARFGTTGFATTLYHRRTLLPGLGAAIVACAAEASSGRPDPVMIGLALGCTLFVGWTLSRIDPPRHRVASEPAAPCLIGPAPAWIVIAVVAAALFVLGVGPVAANR